MLNLGVVRIGSLASFADLEDDQRDEFDGVARNEFRDIHVADADDERQRPLVEALRGLGVVLEGCTDVQIAEFQHQRRINGHALCFTSDVDSKAFAAGGKTAVVEVTDLPTFLSILSATGGARMGARVHYGKVEYNGAVGRNLLAPTQPSPFVKNPRFQAEAEHRAFWQTEESKAITLLAPAVIPLLRRVR